MLCKPHVQVQLPRCSNGFSVLSSELPLFLLSSFILPERSGHQVLMVDTYTVPKSLGIHHHIKRHVLMKGFLIDSWRERGDDHKKGQALIRSLEALAATHCLRSNGARVWFRGGSCLLEEASVRIPSLRFSWAEEDLCVQRVRYFTSEEWRCLH